MGSNGLTLLTLAVIMVASGGIAGTDWLQAIPLVLLVRLLGLDMTGLNRLSDTLWESKAARRELARQALREVRDTIFLCSFNSLFVSRRN